MNDLQLRFGTFNREKWVNWLDRYLARSPIDPRLEVYEGDRFAALIRLFTSLDDSGCRIAFGEAVCELLQSTPLIESSSERLSHLIDLVDYCTPVSGKSPIRRMLTLDLFWHLKYGETVLHPSILNAAAAYGVDEELERFIHNNATINKPFGYLVQCFGTLSLTMQPQVTYYFLERLIPALLTSQQQSILKREMKEVVRRLGCAHLLLFAMDRGLLLDVKYPEQMAMFGDVLQSCLEKYLGVSEFLKVAQMGDALPRRQVVDVLRRWYQHMLPTRGVRLWDIIDNDDEGRGRPGTFSLYTNEESIYLFKSKDGKAASLFEEAKLAATEEIVQYPNFKIDIQEADLQFQQLIDTAGRWVPPLEEIQ
jgi:hypothetical protein